MSGTKGYSGLRAMSEAREASMQISMALAGPIKGVIDRFGPYNVGCYLIGFGVDLVMSAGLPAEGDLLHHLVVTAMQAHNAKRAAKARGEG